MNFSRRKDITKTAKDAPFGASSISCLSWNQCDFSFEKDSFCRWMENILRFKETCHEHWRSTEILRSQFYSEKSPTRSVTKIRLGIRNQLYTKCGAALTIGRFGRPFYTLQSRIALTPAVSIEVWIRWAGKFWPGLSVNTALVHENITLHLKQCEFWSKSCNEYVHWKRHLHKFSATA